jgi:5-methyltetrahydrofolate--homocysteine methyltransferase
MDKADTKSRGTLVLATVKGDVHDIGKNLVDIILTNSGYTVVNLGIQCPLDRMLAAFEERRADAIGMSGLLVKSTLIMKENLEVLNERNVLPPVILGGAALTRRFVEEDLRAKYHGHVEYANDAFDGLRFMERLASGDTGAPAAPPATARPPVEEDGEELSGMEAKIALAPPGPSAERRPAIVAEPPRPPFYGSVIVEEVPLNEIFGYINEVALFRGQWQVRKGKSGGAEYERLIEETIRPEYERLKRRSIDEHLLQPKVAYGYFPCQSEGDDLVIYGPRDDGGRDGTWEAVAPKELKEWMRFTFPRQRADRRRCIADFFASRESGKMDVVAFHVVTMGSRASEVARELFAANRYTEYLYFHGLGVESAEALAEYWHKRVRRELGIDGKDATEVRRLFSQQYQGSRYSFGYPACPSLEDQAKLFELLRPERIGVSLTEEFQLVPEQSTSALIVHHPEARYFNVS